MDPHHPKSTAMHFFPGHPFHLPPLIRGCRVIPPPSTYQPPHEAYQPVVLAYPATMCAEIGRLAMCVIMSLGRDDHAPPTLTWAPRSLAVPA